MTRDETTEHEIQVLRAFVQNPSPGNAEALQLIRDYVEHRDGTHRAHMTMKASEQDRVAFRVRCPVETIRVLETELEQQQPEGWYSSSLTWRTAEIVRESGIKRPNAETAKRLVPGLCFAQFAAHGRVDQDLVRIRLP